MHFTPAPDPIPALRECLEVIDTQCPSECLGDACACRLCERFGCMHAKAQRARDAINAGVAQDYEPVGVGGAVKWVPSVPGARGGFTR